MKKSKQTELIEKIIKSSKPNQETKEFKKLQMYWYNKLEDQTDYKDIERTGTMRSKYYDEYNGLIKHYSWLVTQKYDFNAHQYYQILRKISWDGVATSNSFAFEPHKPFKTHKMTTLLSKLPKIEEDEAHNANKSISDSNNPSSQLNNPPSQPKDSTKKTIKTQKLSKVNRRILYLAGDGKGIREISAYLRKHLAHHAPKLRRGHKGKPFSVFWVHTRLKKLLKDIVAGHILEAPGGGEVRKSGLALDSYIYTENNND